MQTLFFKKMHVDNENPQEGGMIFRDDSCAGPVNVCKL